MSDISVQPDDAEQVESPPEGEPQIQMVAVPPPLQWQLGIPTLPNGAKIVALAFQQGGWIANLQLNSNDAITLGIQLRKIGKEAGSGIVRARTPLLGADGAPLSVVPDVDDEDDDDSEVAE